MSIAAAALVACSSPSDTDKDVPANAATNGVANATTIGEGVAPTYVAAATFALGLEPLAPALGDFDGDGRTDAAIANQFSADVQLLLADGQGGFSVAGDTFSRAFTALAADFDGDGKDDLALSVDGEARVDVVLDVADTPFVLSLSTAAVPDGLAAGDFDADGHTDLAVSIAGTLNEPASSVAVFPWDEATFGPETNFAVGLQPRALRAAGTDLVALLGLTSAVVLRNDGSGSFAASAPFGVGTGVLDFVLIDLDGSGADDLVAADLAGGTLNASLDLAGVDAAPLTEIATPFGVTTMHANDDGVLDVACTSVDDAAVWVLLSKPDGTFGRARLVEIPGAVRLGGLAATDLDGDGLDDLLVVERNRDAFGTLHVFLSDAE